MSEVPQLGNSSNKSFWERPEGWTGMILLVLAAAGFIAYSSAIVALLANTFTAILLGLGIAAVVYVALDPKFRNIVSTLYKMVCRKLTGLIIEMDPIAIVNQYIDKLTENRDKMNDQISKLRQQMGSLDRIIADNEKNRVNNLALAKQAQQQSNDGQVMLKTRQAGRLQNSNLNLTQLATKLKIVYRVLLKMYDNTGIVLEDTKSEVETRTREFNAIKASSNAFRSAMSIINGDSDKKMMFDQSMQFMADNIGERVGEMEHFMDISKDFMDGIDLQNGVFESDGLKMLEEWEKKSSSTLLLPGDDKQQAIAAGNDDTEDDTTVKVGRKSRYV